MRKILKGAIVLFVAALMILTTFAASADTVNYKNESPDVSNQVVEQHYGIMDYQMVQMDYPA
jgi:hypothetical protein